LLPSKSLSSSQSACLLFNYAKLLPSPVRRPAELRPPEPSSVIASQSATVSSASYRSHHRHPCSKQRWPNPTCRLTLAKPDHRPRLPALHAKKRKISYAPATGERREQGIRVDACHRFVRPAVLCNPNCQSARTIAQFLGTRILRCDM
jgi:hypothetical protein